MTQFTWYDGSLKYLHIDVHLIEGYQVNTCIDTVIPVCEIVMCVYTIIDRLVWRIILPWYSRDSTG